MVKFKSLDRCSTTSSYSTSPILCKWHHQAGRLDIKKGALGAWVQPVAPDSFLQPWNVWNQAQTLSVLSKPCWPTVLLITVFPVLTACVHSHPHSGTSPSFQPPLVTTAAKSHPRPYHSVNAYSTRICKVIYIYTESKCLVTQGFPPSGGEGCWFPLVAQCVPTANLSVRSHQLLVSLLWDSDV